MYEDSYGLNYKPFGISPDPQFLFLTPQHREAATGLIYAILKHKGLVTLTGDAGTGKTTILRAVLNAIGTASVSVAYLPVPTLNAAEFLELLLLQYGLLNTARANKAERLLILERFLLKTNTNNRTALLVVDEAHKLSKELLEEIRLLTNFNTRQGSLIQVVLAGQSDLNDLLRDGDMGQLKQRVAYRFHLRALSPAEVREYLDYRWKRAGGTSKLPFDDDAVEAVARYSGGIPRVINAICDNALMMAFADNAATVNGATVQDAARDLDLIGPAMGLPLEEEDELEASMVNLELTALANTAAGNGVLPSLGRRVGSGKQSWLARSAKRLLSNTGRAGQKDE